MIEGWRKERTTDDMKRLDERKMEERWRKERTADIRR